MPLGCDDCDFCDYFSGRLLLSHHRDDPAAGALVKLCQTGQIDHVSYVEDMSSKLSALGVLMPDGFNYEFHLLMVPQGQEIWKINYLRFYYQNEIVGIFVNPDRSASIAPLLDVLSSSSSHMLLTTDAAMSFYGAHSVGFQFDTAVHGTYKGMLGLPDPSSTGEGVTVAVIDSGLSVSLGIPTNLEKNFGDEKNPNDIDDLNGHGSAVASIIHDIVPDASLNILKVGDSNPVSEWNVLSALLAAGDSDVVNLSVGFGLGFRDCPTCGRLQTHSSRSSLFELTIDELARIRPELVVVAAAGNRNQKELDFPARFANVVAIGAVNSKGERSSFGGSSGSNYGTVAAGNQIHDLLFFAPGGGTLGVGSSEYVGETTVSGTVQKRHGTSFSAPYAAALFAHYLGNQANEKTRGSAIDHFVNVAKQSIVGYDAADHGHGLIRIL